MQSGVMVWVVLAAGALWWNIGKAGWHGVTVCDVGQGLAVVVKDGKEELLIDGGRYKSGVETCLSDQMPVWDREIEVVAVTHGDSDHSGGLEQVVGKYAIVEWWTGSTMQYAGVSNSVMDLVRRKRLTQRVVGLGSRGQVGRYQVKVLHPGIGNSGTEADDTNANSLVVSVKDSLLAVLVTGDATAEVEQALVWRNLLNEPVDVLVVGHHGSKTSTSVELLAKLKPKLAVISVGKNRYNHPNSEVLDRLKLVKIWRTDERGSWDSDRSY